MKRSDKDNVTLFKLIVVGNSEVGKSSIITRFCDDTFSVNFISTIGIDFKVRNCDVDGEPVKLQIWDTAGQERFRTITTAFYRGAHAAIIVFDVNEPSTMAGVDYWIGMCNDLCMQDVPVIIVGNKIDLPNTEDAIEQGEILAQRNNVIFMKTSAKDGTNIMNLFYSLVRMIRVKQQLADEEEQRQKAQKKKDSPKGIFSLLDRSDESEEGDNKGCCQ